MTPPADAKVPKDREDHVILVDADDAPIGTMEKMEAHRQGRLHRAFSIFLFNTAGDLLLHQRALSKYHSGGLWTNTCCSHPRDGETVLEAAHRRLEEEMGMTAALQPQFSFIYKRMLDQGLTEHEFDHVLFATSDAPPIPNPDEVASYRYASLEDIAVDIAAHPDQYTEWFKICFHEVQARRRA